MINSIRANYEINFKGAEQKTPQYQYEAQNQHSPANANYPAQNAYYPQQNFYYNFLNAEAGKLLPKNAKVLVNKNAKLLLGEDFELDLSDKNISKRLNSLRQGEKLTIGRNGDIATPIEHNTVSRQHLVIENSHNYYIVQDISSTETRMSLSNINNDEFVRNKGNDGREINPVYLKTSKEVRKYFSDLIDSGSYAKDFETYKNVIKNAHKIAYCGVGGKDFWYIKNGQYININPYKFQEREYATNDYAQNAKYVESIAQYYRDPYRADLGDNYVYLPWISTEGLPRNQGTKHIYQSSDYTEQYLYQMYRTSCEALNMIYDKAPERVILSKLAEHYQYSSCARPFVQINNSLFMNEINTLLSKAGLKTINHDVLDHAAQRLQPQAFQQFFIDFYYITNGK